MILINNGLFIKGLGSISIQQCLLVKVKIRVSSNFIVVIFYCLLYLIQGYITFRFTTIIKQITSGVKTWIFFTFFFFFLLFYWFSQIYLLHKDQMKVTFWFWYRFLLGYKDLWNININLVLSSLIIEKHIFRLQNK